LHDDGGDNVDVALGRQGVWTDVVPASTNSSATFHLPSVCGLRPLAVANDIWQLPGQFHCFSLGPEIAAMSTESDLRTTGR
jgi:hypothetical protein